MSYPSQKSGVASICPSMLNFIFEQNFIDIPLVGGGFTLSSN